MGKSIVEPQIAERYRFIDFLLFFKGRFTRLELVKRFVIGEATASRTIASFSKLNPGLIEYQGTRGGYKARQGFVSSEKHNAIDGLRYLSTGELVEKIDVDCFGVPNYHLQKELDSNLIAAITRGIINQCQVSMQYISTSSGLKSRIVAPHGVFEAGGAWYFRAYDSATYEFRTFKFSRVATAIDIGSKVESNQTRIKDDVWNRMRIVHLRPHPKSRFPDALSIDLGVENTEAKELFLSEACLGFVLNELRVDCSKKHKLNSNEYPLILANREELESVESMVFAPGFCS